MAVTFGGAPFAGAPYTGAGPLLAASYTEILEFLLYDSVNVNFLGKLEPSWERKWSDPFNDAGGGSFSIPADAAIAAGQLSDGSGRAVYNQIVRCRINGSDRFAWIVRENKKGTAKAGEEVDRVLEIAGPGTLAYFGRALVYPERGIGRISPDNRLFDWTSRDYNDAAWVAATQVKQQSAVVTLNSWNGLPLGWADPTAYWLWDSSGAAASNVPDGDVYFRKTFTLANPTTAVLSFTGDDGADVYLDNARLAAKNMDKGHSWPSIARVDLVLDAGPHLLAVKGSNVTLGSLPAGVLNIAGVLLALNVNSYGTTLPGNTDYGAVILHSDSSWKCLGYPPGGPPGMTPGEILRILFTEAQARGALPGVTWSFTDANDSNGSPWTVIPDFGVAVGTTYYSVLRQLAEIACDLHMDPSSMRLDVYNQRGSPSGVSFDVGVNITDAEHQGDGDLANSALLRFTDGWREVISASSIATGGRFESFLSLGTAPSQEQGTLAAQALFADHANARDAVVVTHEGRTGSGEEPYTDYDVGDTVSVPSRDGVTNRLEMVRAITVSEDVEGFPIYTPEVQALSAVLDERLQRWLKRMSMGTHAGQSENASPYASQGQALEKGAVPLATGQGLRYATVVVAASDSVHHATADADFVCSGTADQTTINLALAAVPTGTGKRGGRVLLMDGTYDITGRIGQATFPGTDDRSLVLEGQGPGTVLNITADLGANRIIQLFADDGFTVNASCAVKNLRIDGNTHTCLDGVYVLGARPVIENVWINRLVPSGAAFNANASHYTAVLINCQASVITGTAFSPEADRAVLLGCGVEGLVNGYSFDGSGMDDAYLIGCQFAGTGAGVGFGGVINFPSPGWIVGSLLTAQGIALQVVSIGAQVIGNHIASTANHSVVLDGDACILQGNRINGASNASFDFVNVTGDNNNILGNFLAFQSGTQPRTGIRIESSADRTAVLANVIKGITTSINNLGTNTMLSYTGGASGDNLVY